MKVLLVSSYPDNYRKSRSIFVYRLMQSLIKNGCQIVIISPQNWRHKRECLKSLPGEKVYGEEQAIVYRPKYFDFPNRIKIGKYSLGRLNARTYASAVKRIIRKLDFQPDIIYGHFLYRAGAGAVVAAQYYNVPAIVALGESTLDKHKRIYGLKAMEKLIHQFPGVISVSQKNKRYIIDNLNYMEDRIRVIPNAVNHQIFYPHNKVEMREKYNLPRDKFIVAFIGHFIDRKGPLRVLEAINRIEGNIGGIFMGSGPNEPHGKKVLFKGRVAQVQVSELLSAADLFVLPTTDEGSCNSILEAMACGLPVISSNIEAVKEQISEKQAILVDPNEINGLKKAIKQFYENPQLLKEMTKKSLEVVSNSSLKQRTLTIKNFMDSIIY